MKYKHFIEKYWLHKCSDRKTQHKILCIADFCAILTQFSHGGQYDIVNLTYMSVLTILVKLLFTGGHISL